MRSVLLREGSEDSPEGSSWLRFERNGLNRRSCFNIEYAFRRESHVLS